MWSSPSRRRGLKLNTIIALKGNLASPPSRGAWIEAFRGQVFTFGILYNIKRYRVLC